MARTLKAFSAPRADLVTDSQLELTLEDQIVRYEPERPLDPGQGVGSAVGTRD
jgi:hypothetical protein